MFAPTSQPPINILVIGYGAVGILYSYILSHASPNVRITALCRSSYDQASTGIELDSLKFGKVEGFRPFRVVKSEEEAREVEGGYDYIMLCVKWVPLR